MTLMEYCLAVKKLLDAEQLKQVGGDVGLMRHYRSQGLTPEQCLHRLKKRRVQR